jgi:hypothetical protein
VRPGSVVVPGTEMRVFAKAYLVQRDRRACLDSWRGTAPWWRSSGAVQTCSGLRLRRDAALVTTAQVLAASCDLLSHLVEDGGVCCVECVCSCSGVCSCGGVCFGPLCNIDVSSYMT